MNKWLTVAVLVVRRIGPLLLAALAGAGVVQPEVVEGVTAVLGLNGS